MNELTHNIFELLLYKIGIVKSIFKTVIFPIILRKTMLHIWCNRLFIYWSVFDGKKNGGKRHEQAIRDHNLH